MNTKMKIGIVIVLAIVVTAVFALKHNQSRSPQNVPDGKPADVSGRADSAKLLPKLIDLGADKCVPCKMMAPVLEELKKEYVGRLDVQFIDLWKNPDGGKAYNIKLIPTQIFFDATGKELFRHEGFFSKEDILGKFKEFGIQF